MKTDRLRPDSIAVHAGTTPDERTGAIMNPIFQTSTFVQESPGVHRGWDYSRAGNPTRDGLETALAALEGARYGLSFSSGLAAEQALIQILNPPARVVVADDVYGGTGRLFRTYFAKYGIQFDFVDLSDLKVAQSSLSQGADLVWIETPSNPMMKIIDIAAVCDVSKKHGATTVVDNTFASPVFQSPLQLGADLVLHSATKYLGGHSDLIGGAIMTSSDDLFQKIHHVQFAGGAVPAPFESFLLHRSLKTLHVRMQRHASNALRVADFLADHPKVEQIFFPGHVSHPQHALASKQMSGFSGMISLRLRGNYDSTVAIIQKLRLFQLAESLGGVESLVNHPERMTHASVPEELRKKLGIGPNLIRLSVGIEDPQDLIDDLDHALTG